MQRKGDYIYSKTAENIDEPLDLVKSIGDSVFSCLRDRMKDPQNLITDVIGLGRWYLRGTRYRDRLEGLKNSLKNPTFPAGPHVQEEIDYLQPKIDFFDAQYDKWREAKKSILQAKIEFNNSCENPK